jgi:hypothetical protein
MAARETLKCERSIFPPDQLVGHHDLLMAPNSGVHALSLRDWNLTISSLQSCHYLIGVNLLAAL